MRRSIRPRGRRVLTFRVDLSGRLYATTGSGVILVAPWGAFQGERPGKHSAAAATPIAVNAEVRN